MEARLTVTDCTYDIFLEIWQLLNSSSHRFQGQRRLNQDTVNNLSHMLFVNRACNDEFVNRPRVLLRRTH